MKRSLVCYQTVATLIVLLCSASNLRAQRQDKSLMTEPCRPGTAAELLKIEAEDIKSLQIYDFDPFGKKRYREHAVTAERHKSIIVALLKAYADAKPFKISAGVPRDLCPPDRILVVEPIEGEPFQIEFSNDLGEPFAGRYSLELKETLHALGGGRFPLSIICLQAGKVVNVYHENVIAPHRGGIGGVVTAALQLNRKGGLALELNITEAAKTLVEGELPIHFGEAKVFPSKADGVYIVLLHKP